MRDPYYGHRDPFTGKPIRDRDEWTEWDFILVATYQLMEDLTDKHGLLVHETSNERVMVSAKKEIDRFQAVVDRMTQGTKKKGYTPQPGEYFVPVLELRGGDWPTVEEYFEQLSREDEEDDDE